MKREFLGLCVALAVAASAPGCASDAECDPGQELKGGECVVAAAGGADAGSAGAAGSSGGAAGGGAAGTDAGGAGGTDSGACKPDAGAVSIGTACTDSTNHSDCGCPAHFCAIQPGQTTGICTFTGCKDAPSICPSGYTCLDLSVFDPTQPSVCVAN